MSPSPNELNALLERHAVRRSHGTPTVSVLVGPPGAGARLWRRWAAGCGRSVVAWNGLAGTAVAWVAEVARRVDLPGGALAALAHQLGCDPTEFRASWHSKTTHDMTRFWDTVAAPPDTPAAAFRALCENASAGRDDSPEGIAAILFPAPADAAPVFAALRCIGRIAAATALPGVLVTPSPAADPAGWLRGAMADAARWAVQLPEIPMAVAVPSAAWPMYLSAAPESRVKALLREGAIAVPVESPAAIAHRLAQAGLAPGDAAGAAHVLCDSGPAPDLVERAAEAVRATGAITTAETDVAGRSAAERFLFTFLESLPETAGRFALNAELDFRFGPRPAEVDLLAGAERIAIEIDGYFHFLGPEAYRRDRDKDWELQRRGFVVLRFLAEDVVRRLEQVRDRILDALARTPTRGNS